MLRLILKLFDLDRISSPSDDEDMPKVDPASSVQKFTGLLHDDFQTRFDAWKSEVERTQNGTLEITHEEIIANGNGLLIFYRVVPRPAIARRR